MTSSTTVRLLLTLGLGLGLLSTPALADNRPFSAGSALAEASRPTSTSSPIDQQLLGQWQTTAPSGQSITFVFAPGGKLFLMIQVPDGPKSAKEMRYKINADSQPMHLDVGLSNTETVLTVFELTAEGQMRLQLKGTNPGIPRPDALSEEATLFTKVSDATTLPENTEVIGF